MDYSHKIFGNSTLDRTRRLCYNIYMARKLELTLSDDEQIDKIANALSAKVRRKIIRLSTEGSYSVMEMAQFLNMPVSTVSFHLKMLREAGLIQIVPNPTKKGNEKIISQYISLLQFDFGLFHEEKTDVVKGLDGAIRRQQAKADEAKSLQTQSASQIVRPEVKDASLNIAKAPVVQPSIYDDGEIFAEIDKSLSSGYEIIGQIFNTYLILQQDGVVYLIDQHAAHERFLYDKLIERTDNRESLSQPMLVPYVLDCDNAQHDFILACSDNLKTLGFEIEDFGGLSFKISAVPEVLGDMNLGVFFTKIFSERGKIGNMKNSDLINDALAQWACKSAIKAGDKLTEEQIRSLLSQMKDGVPVQCPHGRPAIVAITRKDLDKLFKRIV